MWELVAWAAAILTAIATAAGLFWSPLYRDAPYWTEQARGIDLAYVGIVLGALLLVPPLPAFGSIPTTLSYSVVIPSVVWSLLVARGLFRMARQGGGS
jgi:hypothetical protein